MSKIITVTLNPSLDRTLFVHHLAEGYRNTVADTTRIDPAGRGVNVSRALHAMDSQTHAVILLGRDAIGRAYQALVEEEAINTTLVRCKGLTRSNIIIFDSGNHHETQIIEEAENPNHDESDTEAIVHSILKIAEVGDTVCLSGVLPRGVPVDIYSTIMQAVKAVGAKTVLAADGIALEVGLKSNPDFIALRNHELEAFFNFPVRTQNDVIYSARKLSERSGGSMILVAHHEMQYGLITNETTGWVADIPPAEEDGAAEGTTSGVQDAFLAGFLSHYRVNDDIANALKWAMACAMFTRAKAGNEFGKPDDMQPYFDMLELSELSHTVSS